MRLLEFERRVRGWSQEYLADRAGLHRTEISLLEKGRLRPSPAQAARLSVALGIEPDALFMVVDACLLRPAEAAR